MKSLLVSCEVVRENLDGNCATKLSVVGTVDFSHAACADLRVDFITT
jgi:hypothetical protein